MAGSAVSVILLPGLARFSVLIGDTGPQNVFESKLVSAFLVIIGLYMLGGTMYFGMQLAGTAVSGHPARRRANRNASGKCSATSRSSRPWLPAAVMEASLFVPVGVARPTY